MRSIASSKLMLRTNRARRAMSSAALGLSLTYVACVGPEESPGFDPYTGPAVASTNGGDSDAGDTGNSGGASTGSASGGATTGAASNGGSTNGGVSGGTGGTVTGAASTGGGASGGGTGSASGGAATGSTGTNGATTGGSTTGGNGGTTGGTTGGSSGGTTGSPGVSSFSFSVLTKAIGGEYAPRNVGAIWITNSSGTFVKTLELWARLRLKYLTLFQQQTNRNSVDAVTSATLTNHRVHNATWDLKDLNGNVVPDGMYNLVIETSDHDTVSHTIPFMKSSTPLTLSPPDVTNYTQMTITLQ